MLTCLTMPFRRRNRRVSRRRRRVFRRRRRPRMRRRRRLALDPERKDNTTVIAAQTIPSTGTIILLNGVATGANPDQRIGRQALWLSASGQMNFNLGAAALVPQAIKVWLILDRQPQGIAMVMADFLDTATLPTISARNLENTARFKVLWTRRIVLQAFIPSKLMTVFKPMRITSRHFSTLPGIANMSTNALFLIFASDVAVALPTVDFTLRLRFVG